MITKLRDFYFLILLTNVTFVIYLIFAQEKEPNMISASISFLLISILSLVIILYSKNSIQNLFKWLNIFTFTTYILLGIVFMLIMQYASPDNKVYSFEAIIFLLSIIIASFSMIFYLKKS